MTDNSDIILEGFKTKPYKGTKTHRWLGKKRKVYSSHANSKWDMSHTVSMLIKLGLCVAACTIVLFMCISGTTQEVSSNNDSTHENEDTFGRLKYVEFPGIAEVFAISKDSASPVEYSKIEYINNGKMACFYVYDGSNVKCIDAGVVYEIGYSDVRGNYVSIKQEDGRVASYYGLRQVIVELGQPLYKGDRLGISGYIVCYSLNREGKNVELFGKFGN